MFQKNKAIIIGLDGADYNIVKKFIEKGYLPNLKKISENGLFTILNSSFVPITPIAWTSITTGKNPGKHGIFDWSIRKGDSYEYDITSSFHCKAERLWNILNKYGLTTGVFNIPITYPPDDVNGFFVSGFDTPSLNSDFTRPKELKQELLNNIKDYQFFIEAGYTKGEERRYAEMLKKHLTAKRNVINFLLNKYDYDFLIFVVMELDHLHHKLWKLVENESDIAVEVYALADEIVGDIIRKNFGKNIFVISDHGGGRLEGVVYLNKWLMNEGYLKVFDTPFLKIKYLLSKYDLIPKLYKIITKIGLGGIKKFLPKKSQEMLATSFISFNDIDWLNTKAFSMGEFGQIYINTKDKYKKGIVEKDEYIPLVNKIISGLKKIKDKSGLPIVDKIYKKYEIYSGEYLKYGPDIIFNFKDYAYDSSVKFGFEQKDIIGKPEFEDTGTHRREGIFLACGPDIKKTNENFFIDILDITPTILYMYGCPIDKDMDGKVIKDIFKEEFLRENKITFIDTNKKIGEKKVDINEDKEEVVKKLRALGYMD